jgi:hypothetical protein
VENEEEKFDQVITPAMQTAISSHEMFSALVAAGFAKHEALQIVIGMLTAGPRNGGGDDD